MSDLHPSARSLLDRAKHREAALPEDVRGRVRSSVLRRAAALGAAVSTTATATVAAKAGAVLASLATPLVASITAAGLIGAGVLVVASLGPPPSAPVHQALRSPTERLAPSPPSPPPRLPAPETAAPPPPVGPLVEPPAAPAKKAPPPWKEMAAPRVSEPGPIAPAAAEPAPAPVSSALDLAANAPPHAPDTNLADQLDRLHRVREALRMQQPDRALAILGAFDPSGSGPFEEEIEASRVSALCQLGRAAEARSVVDRFMVRWPGSPLASRLRGGCAALGSDR